jgi:polyhydroxyalkanoate synthesis regulator phasin
MTNLKAYVISDFNDGILVANMTELEAKDAKIKALEDEVRDLKTRVKSLIRLLRTSRNSS